MRLFFLLLAFLSTPAAARVLTSMDSALPSLVTTDTSVVFPLGDAESVSVQIVSDVDTPSAKTFDAGGSEISTATFLAQANTDSGDYLVIYDTAGLAWAVAADLTGSDPEPTGALWASIAAARKTQVDLSAATTAASVAAAFELAFDGLTDVPFATDDTAADGTMIFTVTAYGTTTDATTKDENDAGAGTISVVTTDQGVASEVNVTANTITIPAHGLTTGLLGRLTTTGTLPAGVTTGVDYFVIEVDDDTIKLASSLANALLGTAIDLTDQGTDEAVHTFTPTALAGGSVKLQKSNDGTNWHDEGSATNLTADGSILLEKDRPTTQWGRLYITLTAGRVSATAYVRVKGED